MYLITLNSIHLNKVGKVLGQGLSESGRKTFNLQNKKLKSVVSGSLVLFVLWRVPSYVSLSD